MAIAKITGPGLIAIALSVALLWLCVLAQHRLMHRAVAERDRVVKQFRAPQQPSRAVPAAWPSAPLRPPRLTQA